MEGAQNGGSKPESGVRFRDWALLYSCILWGVSSEQGLPCPSKAEQKDSVRKGYGLGRVNILPHACPDYPEFQHAEPSRPLIRSTVPWTGRGH